MDVMLIFDFIIAGLGLYLIISAFRMKNLGELSTIIVNQEDMSRCRDKKGFIKAISMKTVCFGIVALIFGILAFVNDLYSIFGSYFNIIGGIIFIGSWFWFSMELRKARGEFFY